MTKDSKDHESIRYNDFITKLELVKYQKDYLGKLFAETMKQTR